MIGTEWCIYEWVNSVNIGWDNRLLPARRQTIIWTNFGLVIDPRERIVVKSKSKYNNFQTRTYILENSFAKSGHFVVASMC